MSNMGDNTISMVKVGPAGHRGRTVWDEMGHSEIVQIFISHDFHICSLQFQYLENGVLVMSNKYGEKTGSKFHLVKLNYPTEYVTGISGWNDPFILTITIKTNLGIHGPFGKHPIDTIVVNEYSFELGESRCFGGFHGTTSDGFISSIGMYIKPLTLNSFRSSTNVIRALQ